ncbi:DUF5691 domain-containing protein [Rhizobacter sp. LjRoot28]|uniref:DUF5691 domain-containing protein n=1 Tax=Rhizobacter sp. LjRoot28 TaxID=3342309 RepID=UPI003ECD7DBD
MSRTTPWSTLLPVAMIGTDRQTAPLPRWTGEVGRLITEAATPDAAASVLRSAAVLAVCGLAGSRGFPWASPLPAPAPIDTLPPLIAGAWLGPAGWLFEDGPARLQHEFCLALARAGLRLPPSLLPQALDAARRSVALRPRLAPVLGERGAWLASQHDGWRFAAGVAGDPSEDAAWTDGSLDQRRAFLLAERRADPAAARARLAAALPELAARERAELTGVLASSLTLEDEPLLDQLRADRSREVRQVALGMLLRLPDAAHPRRAAARLEALIGRKRGLLGSRWTVDAPQGAASDWKDDQVDANRPTHESLGERAWWLYQLVRQVPLSWWNRHTGLTAAELRNWADDTDWSEALLRGWRDVLNATAPPEWCEAFLANWPARLWRDGPGAVLALLPAPAREAHWLRQLKASNVALVDVLAEVLAAWPVGDALSPTLSSVLATALRPRLQAGLLANDYRARSLLIDLCCALHPETLAALADLPRTSDETPGEAETLNVVAQVIFLRRALQTL